MDESGLTQNEVPLEPGRDYEFDPYQGRIILTKPLDNIMSDSFGSVIEGNDDYENYLVVDYEYVPQGSDSLDAMSYGGRVKGWVNDYIGLGVTYATEEKDNQNYQVYSSDLTLRATEGTFIKAEFAHSEGRQTESNFVSYDGGLTFTPIGDSLEDREGDSIQVTAVAACMTWRRASSVRSVTTSNFGTKTKTPVTAMQAAATTLSKKRMGRNCVCKPLTVLLCYRVFLPTKSVIWMAI